MSSLQDSQVQQLNLKMNLRLQCLTQNYLNQGHLFPCQCGLSNFTASFEDYININMTELLLDDRILWWVFLPIVYVTLSLSIVRIYYSKYNAYKTTKKPIKQKGLYREHEEKNTMAKCDLLIKKYAYLSEEAFNSRRSFLCAPEKGYLTREREPTENVDPMAQMQGMMESMGGTLPTLIFSIVTIGWINYSFGGILLAKVPFNLAQQFKTITQSGVQMENLNVQYISGISFYFFIMFGLGQLYSLFVKDDEQIQESLEGNQKKANAPNAKMGANPMMPPMNPMMPMNQQADPNQKAKDMFKSQVENLSLVQHHFIFENCKNTATERLRKFLAEK